MNNRTKPETPEQRREAEAEIIRMSRAVQRPSGYYSNSIMTRRNGGVQHQFADSQGGFSGNYR